MVDNTTSLPLSINFSTLIHFRVLPKHTLNPKWSITMNFQVKTFLGNFNFTSYQAAMTAASMTGGTIHRILGKQNNQHIVGSAI